MKTKLFSLIAIAIGLITSKANAQTSVVDQQNIPSNTASTISPGQTFGQSFTAGVTGTLTGVAIGLNSGAPTTPCIVKVFAGEGFGGTLLATKNFTTTGSGLNSVTLTTGVNIIAGNKYTFQFSSFGAPIPVNYHNGNTYAGGKFFNNGVAINLADAIFESRVRFVGIPGQFFSSTYNLNDLTEDMNFGLVKPGTSNYRVLVTGVTTTFSAVNIRNTNWNNLFKMSFVPGIAYGETYTVRLSYMQNGVWSPYGPASTVNTPAITPNTQLTTCSPSFTVATTKTLFSWVKVAGATNYRVKVSNQAGTFSVTSNRNSNVNTFALNYVARTQPNVAYDITITAFVGGVWGTEGFPCHVMAMAAGKPGEDDAIVEETHAREGIRLEDKIQNELLAELFPNPSTGIFNLNISENANVIITNIIGDIIFNENIEAGSSVLNIENQPAGIYFTTIINGNSKKVIKIIKQ
jgi:hypothetical protein